MTFGGDYGYKDGAESMILSAHVHHPAIQSGSLPVSQVANLSGYYEIPNKTQDPLLIAHNFSNVLSTMRT